jgi:hypothetical protein
MHEARLNLSVTGTKSVKKLPDTPVALYRAARNVKDAKARMI